MAFAAIGSPVNEAGRGSTSSLCTSPGFDFESMMGTGCDFVMDGNKLKDHFHQMFQQVSMQNKKNNDKKKLFCKSKSRNKKCKGNNSKQIVDSNSENEHITPLTVEVTPNPSAFSVFASVRQSVLERQLQENSKIYLASLKHSSSEPNSEDEEEAIANIQLPRVVGFGLQSVFELIKESHQKHPVFCKKALQALLDILQGQSPESLKLEPPDVVESLFNLLMDLSTSPTTLSKLPHDQSSNIVSYACSCLLSLVVACGNTEKLLAATSSLLMNCRSLMTESIKTPDILALLQRSVHAVLLGSTCRPDWLSRGITDKSQTDSFIINTPHDSDSDTADECSDIRSCIASDGIYLYVHNPQTGILYKIGSGYAETIKGLVYAQRESFYKNAECWLGYARGHLYFKLLIPHASEIKILSCETLKEEGRTELQDKNWGPSVMFSDGDNIGHITSNKDDCFVVQTFKPGINKMICILELPLKLARKCLEVLGTGLFEDGSDIHVSGVEDDVSFIATGKEFGLMRASNGKVMFCGKSQCLGIKQGFSSSDKWAELPIPKSPKIVHFSVGHDGLHALLVSQDGNVYFTGTSRRGEDGDQSKSHRQSKPSKPRKLTCLDGNFIVYSACNYGTSAVISRKGELLMFGKDTLHCDHSTGQITELKDVFITQVGLGKAHTVALSKKGQVFTFGINNKGQCGRDFYSFGNKEVVPPVPMSTANEEECEDEELEFEGDGCSGGLGDIAMCHPGKHRWTADQCMVCTICSECTGYGSSCVSSSRPDRNAGLPCGCGVGDSGCSECGCCRSCAKEAGDIEQHEQDLAAAAAAVAWGGAVAPDGIIDARNGQHEARLQDYFSVGQALGQLDIPNMKSKQLYDFLKNAMKASSDNIIQKPKITKKFDSASLDETANTEHEREASKATSLPPAKLHIPTDQPIIQVSCGLYHTILLAQNGDVYCFGSNQHGQLGQGDFILRGVPIQIKLPVPITCVAAGSNHSVFLSSDGQVFTCGAYQKGQLGRLPPVSSLGSKADEAKSEVGSKDSSWHTFPGLVPNIGNRYGRRATWIGASGDQTFIKIDESLINSQNLTNSAVVANQYCIGLIPSMINQQSSFNCLFINKVDGNCKSFSDENQVDLRGSSMCLDPVYSVLWSFNPCRNRISCYNIISGDIKLPSKTFFSILKPELAIPSQPGPKISCSHAALHILCCLDTLSMAQDSQIIVHEQDHEQKPACKQLCKEDFMFVNRFESHGGGWGYSGHSIEAIRFSADSDVILGGFGLFGGRGEYTAKIKLFDIGIDGGEQETDGELLSETEEIPFECGVRHKHPILFDEPITLQANRWYVAWARVSGPSSDCGSSGQAVVTTDDQVIFSFKSSKKSNNGTDINAGQIPQLLYRILTSESKNSKHLKSQIEPVCILSSSFSTSVTPDCFHSILKLLNWTWQSFKTGICEIPTLPITTDHLSSSPSNASLRATILDLRRLLYISNASLRLLRVYVNEIYPKCVVPKKHHPESEYLAECVANARDLLRIILSDKISQYFLKKSSAEESIVGQMLESILDECHVTFVACYYAFYPTSSLKWQGLCDLLTSMDMAGEELEGYDRLLAAFLGALCSPTIRVISVIPIIQCDNGHAMRKNQTSLDDMAYNLHESSCESHKYPVLVETVTSRISEKSGLRKEHTVSGFKDFLERMLTIVVQPVRQVLGQERITYSLKLVSHVCSLLSLLIAELTHVSTGADFDLNPLSGRPIFITPSRFSRTSQHRTWNTGNGSPDAICFTVDKPGVIIIGVCIYGGMGSYEYELEILDDQSVNNSDPSHTQRWNTLEVTKGSFSYEDCTNDIMELKFEKPVPIKENVKYAIRLRSHGSRTTNGDSGIASVKGPDGTTFNFSACPLSFNGTNRTRGQIPQIIYHSAPQDTDLQQNDKTLTELHARKCALDIVSAIVKVSSDLLYQINDQADENALMNVGSTHIISMLLPLVFAHIGQLAISDPRSAVRVVGLVELILPAVTSLNQLCFSTLPNGANDICYGLDTTTSCHYAVVESDHPYKSATVSNYRVTFPESVKWITVEFDNKCGTAQVEDTLQLLIPAASSQGFPIQPVIKQETELSNTLSYWPVLQKFSGTENWPQMAVVIPGNEVIFSLETATDYVKDEKACFYGFKCNVVGYEWMENQLNGLKHLEKELSYIGGMCASSLMKKDLLLPPTSLDEIEEEFEILDKAAQQVFNIHSGLLSKGFALAHPPTIHQALEGILPITSQSNERSFLEDFVSCTNGTSGGRFARWLQPDSFVDPKRCDLIYSKDDIKCGWPTLITILTKDQYGEVVHVPNLKVQVKAIPIEKKNDYFEVKPRSKVSDSGWGVAAPNLDIPYAPTIKEKMCYYAISLMKPFEKYSFEELRFLTPVIRRPSENMLVRPNNDSSYSANWTPSSIGWYSIQVNIDGVVLDDTHKVEVKEPPQGITPPCQVINQKHSQQPNMVRKLVAKHSAGLRIRSHPSLQSEQIGVIPPNEVISFVDEVHNNDGIWLRLSMETVKKFCLSSHSEAWSLQFNQHFGKTFLVPLEEPKFMLNNGKETILPANFRSPFNERPKHNQINGSPVPGQYDVINCGASGHNIRSRPTLKAPPIGILVLGNQINVIDQVQNVEGTWVKLDEDAMCKYCYNVDGEAWSLAQCRGNVCYLQCVSNNRMSNSDKGSVNQDNEMTELTNYDSNFQDNADIFHFGNPLNDHESDQGNKDNVGVEENNFLFGSTSHINRSNKGRSVNDDCIDGDCESSPNTASKISALQRWLKDEEFRAKERKGLPGDLPPELMSVSVKDLVKAIGESRANGNGTTPPKSVPLSNSRSKSCRNSSQKQSLRRINHSCISSSNPISIPGTRASLGSSISEVIETTLMTSARSNSLSMLPDSHSTQQQTSLTQAQKRSSWKSDNSSFGICKNLPRSNSPVRNSVQQDNMVISHKLTTQTGTQTSPPETHKIHFNHHSSEVRDKNSTRSVTKTSHKDRVRNARGRGDKSQILTCMDKFQSSQPASKQPVPKEALSPSVAESLRAVFSAFLWHEGIVHDAMTCASFLKFHPNLKKQVCRTKDTKVHRRERSTSSLSKEQKARLRHSVEVSASSFLRIAPNTLESLNWSVANANANKNQVCKPHPISEESASDLNSPKDFVTSASKTNSRSDENSFDVTNISHQDVKLPPALHHLVILWEEVSSACKKVIAHQMILPSPMNIQSIGKHMDLDNKKDSRQERDRKQRKKKEWRSAAVAMLCGKNNILSDGARFQSAQSDKDILCELCGYSFKSPLTYHMRQAHPGCGSSANGFGYNSSGTFCGGWAGQCGEGGVMGITWYLLCQKCRDRYLKQKRQQTVIEKPKKSRRKIAQTSMAGSAFEVHQIMKNNAMFLLQFSSASNSSIKGINPSSTPLSKRNSCYGRVSHHSSNEIAHHNPFPNVVFQCLHTLGVNESELSIINDTFFPGNNESMLNMPNSSSGAIPEFIHSLALAPDDKVISCSPKQSDFCRSTGISGFRGSKSFHRSISVGVNPREWPKMSENSVSNASEENEQAGANKSEVIFRKRNNSSGGSDEAGLSLLCYPSTALTKLVQQVTVKDSNPTEVALRRPVMSFILQRHDLDSLHLAIVQALRKASCRVYAMQALNWLLRSVTQPTSLHDLLWCFVAALLNPINDGVPSSDGIYRGKGSFDQEIGICEHPMSDITICGEAAQPLPSVFHALLQTISDVMMLLPLGSSLQQMAIRCWCLKFSPSDHAFLHRSHVFSNISKILSRSEDLDDMSLSFTDSMQVTSIVEQQKNLTKNYEMKASSRQAMISSLTDECTDTFWESGDEDRNKVKTITLTGTSRLHQPKGVYVHIDNSRDLGQKVSHITFKTGSTNDELTKQLETFIENRHSGWVFCSILESSHSIIKLELKGPDNTVRVRQIKVLGAIESESPAVNKTVPASVLQQRHCESDTLKVFRVLTSQVFGKLISGKYKSVSDENDRGFETKVATDVDDDMPCNPESSNDLKEHMVGILFSQNKLTDLQKQVCTHIVQAIKKETARVREEWELTLCRKSFTINDASKSSDIYCFEMLSMVLALSGSSVGRQYLAQQYTLLKDLLSLLHTGSARVQRQVTSLLRRVLPEVMPATLANILGVPSLPPTDFSIVVEASSKSSSSSSPLHSNEQTQINFDMHRVGILDVFLSCIAKALNVQMKVKNLANGKGVTLISLASSINSRDNIAGRWYLRGCLTHKLAEDIIKLLKDMISGKLSEAWEVVTKDAIAENILALTKLDDIYRNPSECLKTPTLWLSLASLCVLNDDHVERLTSGQWIPGTSENQQHQPRPTCDNHDDSETLAIIKCNMCGNLCVDCDRFLHLHSKTRSHQRQIFKEEEEAIKVDLHEGCGRVKLFWVMVLADCQTLKAMIEFRDRDRTKGSSGSVGTCRFCGASSTSGMLAIGNVCNDKECQENSKMACTKALPCGHMCQGVKEESPCLPCLHNCGKDSTLKQDADDMCMICFTEALSCAPAIQLKCGHIFHFNCCKKVLSNRWSGPRISFGFCLCPVCKIEMEHKALQELLVPVRVLFEDVRRKALMRLEYEGLQKADGVVVGKSRYHHDSASFAMDRYAYYVCYKCKKAYFGGEARCDVEAGTEDYDPTELVCGACSDVSRAQMCPKHGTDFLEYKCRYCCSVAVFFCFGTTHFCNACHDDFQRVTNIPKHDLPHCPAGPKAKQLESDECPLHVKHPPTGEEFALGCGVCRNAHTF